MDEQLHMLSKPEKIIVNHTQVEKKHSGLWRKESKKNYSLRVVGTRVNPLK
jgi:hypothetical protein